MYESHTAKLLPPRQFAWRLLRHFLWAAAFVAFSLLIGMLGYTQLGQMTWVDAFMNSSMLLGGMGPVGDLPTDAAKIFAGVYALYAGLVFILSAGVIIMPIAHRVLHRLHVDDDD